MYVYMSDVHGKFIILHTRHLHGIRVEFVYEGHRIKVKVTEAKIVENSYSRNVKLRSAITPDSRSIKHRTVMFACVQHEVFGYS